MKQYLVIALASLVLPMQAAAQQDQGQSAQQQPQQAQAPAPSPRGWNYDQLYSQGWSARGLYRNTVVLGPYGDDIGNVENLILSDEGRVLGVIAEIGGFLDIGDTHVFVPWDQVRVNAAFNRITVPITEDTADQYTFAQTSLWKAETERTRPVEEDLVTGTSIWKLSDILGDYAYLSDRVGYGYIHDLVISRDGNIEGVVVAADANYGGGYRAFPWRGYRWGYGYGAPYYNLGYNSAAVRNLQVLDYDRIAGVPGAPPGSTAATGAGTGNQGRVNER